MIINKLNNYSCDDIIINKKTNDTYDDYKIIYVTNDSDDYGKLLIGRPKTQMRFTISLLVRRPTNQMLMNLKC